MGKTLWNGQVIGMLSNLASQARRWMEGVSARPSSVPYPGSSVSSLKRSGIGPPFFCDSTAPNSKECPPQEGCDGSRTRVSGESGARGWFRNTRIPEQECEGP